MRILKNKRGELTTAQIVVLTVLIVSFAVILIFIFYLNLGETTDEQICHNSVVLSERGGGFIGKLNCKTNEVCISGGDDCSGLTNPVNIKVDASDKDQILEAIAKKMADCWWMFGEGNPNYYESWSGGHCGICTSLEFDRNVYSRVSMTYGELYYYLYITPKDEEQTYLDYLFGDYEGKGVTDPNSFEKEFEFDMSSSLDLSKRFVILTGFNKGNIAYNYGTGHIPVYFIPPSEIDSRAELCEEFDLTKA